MALPVRAGEVDEGEYKVGAGGETWRRRLVWRGFEVGVIELVAPVFLPVIRYGNLQMRNAPLDAGGYPV